MLRLIFKFKTSRICPKLPFPIEIPRNLFYSIWTTILSCRYWWYHTTRRRVSVATTWKQQQPGYKHPTRTSSSRNQAIFGPVHRPAHFSSRSRHPEGSFGSEEHQRTPAIENHDPDRVFGGPVQVWNIVRQEIGGEFNADGRWCVLRRFHLLLPTFGHRGGGR